MVNVEKMNVEEEFIQCSSCMRSTEETDIYKIEVGKTKRQTSILKLCPECLMNLGNQIYEIYQETTDFIDKKQLLNIGSMLAGNLIFPALHFPQS